MPDEHTNENMSGVFLHILADALGSVGVIISALLIKYFSLLKADAICSLVISCLILASIISLFRNTFNVLSLYVPAKLEQKQEVISADILSMDSVCDCTEFKLWRYRSEELVAVVNVEVDTQFKRKGLLEQLKNLLKTQGVKYYTIQIAVIDNLEKDEAK